MGGWTKKSRIARPEKKKGPAKRRTLRWDRETVSTLRYKGKGFDPRLKVPAKETARIATRKTTLKAGPPKMEVGNNLLLGGKKYPHNRMR